MNKTAGSVILGLIIFIAAIALVAIMNNVISIEDSHGNTRMIYDFKEADKVKEILQKYTYDEKIESENVFRDECDYQLTVSSKVYLLKAESGHVETGGKQTQLEKEDLEDLLAIIEKGN